MAMGTSTGLTTIVIITTQDLVTERQSKTLSAA